MNNVITPDFQKQKTDVSFRNKVLLGAGIASASLASVSSVSAQATVIDVASVKAQSDAATTAVTTVGSVLITMAFWLLVFTTSTNIMRRIMGG